MANELVHGTAGTSLTQAEFEAVGLHVLNSQATGDLIYASSAAQLSRLGTGAGRFGSIIVAASNAPADVKALADYICDGTADEVQINQATAIGGIVQLSTGTFTLTSPILLPDHSILLGEGVINTRITGAAAGVNCIQKSVAANVGVAFIEIADLYILTDNTHIGIVMLGWSNCWIHSNRIENCLEGLHMSADDGAGLVGCYWNNIEQNYIRNCVTGIKLTGFAVSTGSNINHIKTNHLEINPSNSIANSIGIDVDWGRSNNLDTNDYTGFETGVRVTNNGSNTTIAHPWFESNTLDVLSLVTNNAKPTIREPNAVLTITGKATLYKSPGIGGYYGENIGDIISQYNSDSERVNILRSGDYKLGNDAVDGECNYIGKTWKSGTAGTAATETTIIKGGMNSLKVSGNDVLTCATLEIKNVENYVGQTVSFGAWVYAPSTNPFDSVTLVINYFDSTGQHWSGQVLPDGTQYVPADDKWHWHYGAADTVLPASTYRIVLQCYANYDSNVHNNVAYFWGMQFGIAAYAGQWGRFEQRDTVVDARSDSFIDIRAGSATFYAAGVDLSAALPINLWNNAQPDCPRNITYTLTHANITGYTIVIIGLDSHGVSKTETITSTTAWTGVTSIPFRIITSIQMTARTDTGAGDTINMGNGSRLGLSGYIESNTCVFAVTKNNLNYAAASYTVSQLYDYVDVSTGGAITDGDDFTIWYQSIPKIIG